MGQNNTHNAYTRPPPGEVKRYPPPRPKAPPSSRPLSDLGPRGPSYYNPENKVLPMELPLKKLRPVSMELSKVHPDFADIFSYDEDVQTKQSLDSENIENSENNVLESNKENLLHGGVEKKGDTPEKDKKDEVNINERNAHPIQNGHIPGMSATTSTNVTPRTEECSGSHTRTNSLDRNHPRKQGHRRQMSATSSLMTAQHTIFEDPEEYSTESRGKIDPLAQSYPMTSLPQKNTFHMDYKEQCTYVQLAEHRRKHHMRELESKTGLKLSDLSADLAENEAHIHAIERDSPTRASTRSTVSMDSGLKKKKRAPPPPGQPPPPPGGPKQNGRPIPNQQHSAFDEPPADYDMDDSPFGSPGTGMPLMAQSAPNTPRGGIHSNVSVITPREGQKHKIPPPPPPPPQKALNSSGETKVPVRQNSRQNIKETPPLSREDSSDSNRRSSVPWLEDIKLAAEKRENRLSNLGHRQQAPSAAPSPPGDATHPPNQVFDSSAVSAETRLASLLAGSETESKFGSAQQSEPVQRKESFIIDKESRSSPTQTLERQNSTTVQSRPSFERQNSSSSLGQESRTSFDLRRQNSSASLGQNTVSLERQSSITSTKTDPGGPVRRLSSLLQHDIKMAAQAKVTKVVKQTTAVPPKPKDPAQVFRETLAKAAAERDHRMKDTSIDEQLAITNPPKSETVEDGKNGDLGNVNSPKATESSESPVVLRTESVTVKRQESNREKGKENGDSGRVSPQAQPEAEKIYKQRFTKNKDKSTSRVAPVLKPRQLTPPSSDDEADRNSQRAKKEWTPEDDLDSDDNLSDRETVTTRKSGTSEGFKSSIIPSKVNDLKTKKGKDKKHARRTSDSSDDKNKYGSIKKFQKSVHKSVRNAFGSIGRASGKLLRKGKTEDLEQSDDVPKNWTLTASQPVPNGDVRQERARKYMVTNGYSDEEEDDKQELQDREELKRSKVMFQANGDLSNSSDSESDKEDKDYRLMKRAGVAYISGKGQIVVLPEYETVKVDEEGRVIKESDEGRAPKIKAQRKKFNYDATVRKKEREQKDQVLSQEVKQNEKKMEDERQKQLMMDLDFQRMREQETRERLQRLEAAQMQHQYNAALTQQHQMSMLSAPPLPPPGGFQGNLGSLPDFSQTNPYSTLLGQTGLGLTPGLGLGFGMPGNLNTPVLNGGLPSTSYDFNDYMRMMGMQSAPGGQQQHQFAYTLNSGNWVGPKPSTSLVNLLTPEQLKYYAAGRLHEFPVDSQNKNVYQVSHWTGPVPTQTTVMQASAVPQTNTSVTEVMSQYQFGASSGQGQTDQSDDFRTNPLYTSSDDSDSGDTLGHAHKRRAGVTTIQVGDNRDTAHDSLGEDMRSSSSPATSSGDPSLPSSPSSVEKIYGPMGFRPVRFNQTDQNTRPETTDR